MPNRLPAVDGYIRKNKRWQAELEALRGVVLEAGLTEEVKWRCPCYTFQGRNVAIIGAFKDHCTLSFFKGALLQDSKKILARPGDNTQAGRVIRFAAAEEIRTLATTLEAYVREAIALEKAGAKVEFKKITEHAVPEELQRRFDADPALKQAFSSLTPGRQRGYLLLFSSAKHSRTREARIDKHVPRILNGKGLDDD